MSCHPVGTQQNFPKIFKKVVNGQLKQVRALRNSAFRLKQARFDASERGPGTDT